MKDYYITPTTEGFYEKITANSAEEALQAFVDSMESDMHAYFKAVELQSDEDEDDDEDDDEDGVYTRLLVADDELDEAIKILDDNGIENDLDSGNRIMIHSYDLDDAVSILGMACIYADEI